MVAKWFAQHLVWRPRPTQYCVRWGPSSPCGKGTAAPTFRPMSVVAKWSPISTTAELLFSYANDLGKTQTRSSPVRYSGAFLKVVAKLEGLGMEVGAKKGAAPEAEAFVTDMLNFEANCKEIRKMMKIIYKQFAVKSNVNCIKSIRCKKWHAISMKWHRWGRLKLVTVDK